MPSMTHFLRSNRTLLLLLTLVFLSNSPLQGDERGSPKRAADSSDSVSMADGVKIGEVTPTSAVIWTRLTAHPERLPEGPDQLEGAVPGAEGLVQVRYWKVGSTAPHEQTAWQEVDPDRGHVRQFRLDGLAPGTRYALEIAGTATANTSDQVKLQAHFRTAPAASETARVLFTVVTGQDYQLRDDRENGHRVYPAMQQLDPDFFVHTGDIAYFDRPEPYAKNLDLARFKFTRTYALPYQRTFHQSVASYFLKDDHDILKDDCWPGQTYGQLTWDQGVALFDEQFPASSPSYRTIRWGRDLQIWLAEGREFRSPNTQADGPEKTIWGEKQKKWFFRTFGQSDATFRILISPTPIVGPDRKAKNDNHANQGFTFEGDQIRQFLGTQTNAYVICGDRHWQYISVDPKTGVREYSSGPTNNAHSGGYRENQRTPMHRFLRIRGGFLSVTVERRADVATLTVRHHDMDGKIVHEDVRHQQGLDGDRVEKSGNSNDTDMRYF